MQEEKILSRIEKICHDIWSDKDGASQQAGKFIMDSISVIQNILHEIQTGQIHNISENTLLQTSNALMEGLQYKDQFYLADILYFELNEIIKIYEKEKNENEPV